MNKKISLLSASFVMPLLFMIILVQSVNLAAANLIPIWDPIITIKSDGSIEPSNVPINRTGNVYTLTGNITGYSLDIQCGNITVDGAGYAVLAISILSRITVEADGVTVKNFADAEAGVTGSFNTIAKNTLASVSLVGDYNNVTGNRIGGHINMQGDYNSIARNIVQGIDVSISYSSITGNFISKALFFRASSFNTIVGNELKDCPVVLGREPNTFYLNNFINNTFKVNFDPDLDSPTVYSVNVFDNSSIGNYWSDYNGTDANHDGIGDSPYVIDGTVIDRYPLAAPYDIENNTIIVPYTAESFPTTLAVASAVTATVVIAAGISVYFRKRKRF